jgi:hypothetical protein
MLFGLHRQPKQEGSKTATVKAWTKDELAQALQQVESFLTKSRQEWSENDILMQQLIQDRTTAEVMAKHQVAPGRNARRVLGSEGLPTPRQTAKQRSTIGPTGAEIEDISVILRFAHNALEQLTAKDCELVRDGGYAHGLPAHDDAAYYFVPIPFVVCKPVAVLLSYLGSSDAVTRFIAPTSVGVWQGIAQTGLADPDSVEWPSTDAGNLLASKRLWDATSCPATQTLRMLVSAVIMALCRKSVAVNELYQEAEELRDPTPATQADVAFHTNPLASGSFYYFNAGAAPLNRLESYDEEEADSEVDCSKTVCEVQCIESHSH